MSINRKTAVVSTFLVGAMIFTTAAFADVIIGSGYGGAKAAVKQTMKTLTKDTDNFTSELSYEVKFDGKTFASEYALSKMDIKNNITSREQKSLDYNSEYGYYNYFDSKQSITKEKNDDSYYVYKRDVDEEQHPIMTDPFEEEITKDAEKVIDAFVGNLKDFVQAEDDKNGGKLYYGQLQNSQIPAFANALSSFVVKYSILNDRSMNEMNLSSLKNDLYLKDVSGKLHQTADGIIDNAVGSGTICGKDEDGNAHEITISFSANVKDINNTVVQAPDLTNQKVIETNSLSGNVGSLIDESYIGTYKNNIVVKEGDKYVKKGERVLEIYQADKDNIVGKYYETGIENPRNFEIFGKYRSDVCERYLFEYTNEKGEKENGIVGKTYNSDSDCNLRVELGIYDYGENKGYSSNRVDNFTSEFIRVFD